MTEQDPPVEAQEGGGQKLSFEQSLQRLETIVSQIEQGEVPLEASIERYAEGIQLIKQCRAILERAEKKIQLLTKAEGEALEINGELPDEEEA